MTLRWFAILRARTFVRRSGERVTVRAVVPYGCPVRGRAHSRQPAAPMRAGLIGVLSIFTFTSLMMAFRSGVSLMAETAAVPEGIRQGLEIHRTRNMFAPGVLGPGPA